MPCEDSGRDLSNAADAKGHQRWLANLQELGERHGTHSPPLPPQSPEETNLANGLILDVQPLEQ